TPLLSGQPADDVAGDHLRARIERPLHGAGRAAHGRRRPAGLADPGLLEPLGAADLAGSAADGLWRRGVALGSSPALRPAAPGRGAPRRSGAGGVRARLLLAIAGAALCLGN